MKISTGVFPKDPFLYLGYFISLLLILIGFAVSYDFLTEENQLLVIHFDAFRGIDFLGDKFDVFNVLWISLLITLVNFFLSAILYYRERFLSYLIEYFNIFFALLILIAVAVIISVN